MAWFSFFAQLAPWSEFLTNWGLWNLYQVLSSTSGIKTRGTVNIMASLAPAVGKISNCRPLPRPLLHHLRAAERRFIKCMYAEPRDVAALLPTKKASQRPTLFFQRSLSLSLLKIRCCMWHIRFSNYSHPENVCALLVALCLISY